MLYHVNINQDKWGMAIIISGKVDFEAKLLETEKGII